MEVLNIHLKYDYFYAIKFQTKDSDKPIYLSFENSEIFTENIKFQMKNDNM